MHDHALIDTGREKLRHDIAGIRLRAAIRFACHDLEDTHQQAPVCYAAVRDGLALVFSIVTTTSAALPLSVPSVKNIIFRIPASAWRCFCRSGVSSISARSAVLSFPAVQSS